MKSRDDMHPKEKGELVEQIIITEFMKRGIPCLRPIGDNQPYDLVIDVNETLFKVQSRTARYNSKYKSALVFNCLNCRVNTSGIYRTDHRDKFDIFASVVIEQPNVVYIVKSAEAVTNSVTLGFECNRLKSVKKAADYTIDKWLSSL